jgi:hypothetical protein
MPTTPETWRLASVTNVRPERERGDRLRTSRLHDRRRASSFRRVQDERVDRSIRARRRAYHDLPDAGDECRHDGHRDRRRVHRSTARDVAPDRPERRHAFAEPDAVTFVPPFNGQLPCVQIDQSLHEPIDRRAKLHRNGVERRYELVRRRDDARFAKVGTVESKRQIEERCVTLTADAFDRVANGGGYVGIDLEASGLEPLPPIPEVEELEH